MLYINKGMNRLSAKHRKPREVYRKDLCRGGEENTLIEEEWEELGGLLVTGKWERE